MSTQIAKYKTLKNNVSNKLCLAPYTSLRFTVLGNIQVCCFNRLYTLGKYPDISIHDAWFGKKIEVLQKSIENNDLSLGCGYCSNSINNNLFNSVGANNYDYLNSYYDKNNIMPTMLDFELGNNCNLECIMCNGENSALIRKNREFKLPYTPPYNNDFITQLDEFIPYLKEARFVGGEPFLIELNYKIWERIIEINPSCKITILTNCTILNDKIKTILNKGNFILSVSTDGITKETYEKIRINANFEEFNINLKYFLNYSNKNNFQFFLNFCPMIYNWSEIPEMFKFCNANKVHIILHTVLFPPKAALWILNESELNKIKNFLIKNKPNFFSLKNNLKNNKVQYESIINQIENWINISNNVELSNLCQDELISKFNNKLTQYINNSKIYENIDKLEILKELNNKFDILFLSFDKQNLNKLLIFLNSFSIELIIAELSNNTIDKVQERLNYGIK